MYISPLILLVLEPAFGFGEDAFATGLAVCRIFSVRGARGWLGGKLTERIGGTSTCCMPFLACI